MAEAYPGEEAPRLAPALLLPHFIANEERTVYEVPGLVEFHCSVCQRLTIKARTSPATTCGWSECDKPPAIDQIPTQV